MSFSVADAHCDYLYYAVNDGWNIEKPSGAQAVCLPYMLNGGYALQCFAAWPESKQRTSCLQQALFMIEAFCRMLDDTPALVQLSKNFSPDDGRIAAMLTVEGGEALHGLTENLRLFYRLGVRAMTLTWNNTNELASPAMRKGGKGLTPLGRSIVAEMDAIGMALDVAHLSDAGIDDAFELYGRPIYSSHTNSRAVCDHARSLSDRHIERIARSGGVVAVNYYPPQLTGSQAACTDDVVTHIKHIASVGGVNCVALGSDFDGMIDYPADLKNCSDVPALLEKLRYAGFSDADISRIAYGNLHDFLMNFV